VSDIIVEVEDVLTKFDNALRTDALQCEEQVRKAAKELAEQQCLLEEKETKHITSECAKHQMFKELSKEYGGGGRVSDSRACKYSFRSSGLHSPSHHPLAMQGLPGDW
jgi:D-ribose pyranose/furanose isomerase RbsD